MRWNIGTKIGAGFGIGLVIFVLVGATSYRTTGEMIEAARWREHTYEVLRDLDQMFSLLQDIEIGLCGYALTDDETYLGPYEAARSRLEVPSRDLRQLTADNPRQQHRLDLLDPLVDGLIAQARESVAAIREKGSTAGVETIKSSRAKATMDEIRKLVAELEGEELGLLQERAQRAAADADLTRRTIVIGIATAVLVTVLAALFIGRDIAAPLREMSGIADRIAEGDLSAVLHAERRDDEVGRLMRAFSRMTDYLRRMAEAADRIAAGELRASVEARSANDLLGGAFVRMVAILREQRARLGEGAHVLGEAASEIVASTAQLAAGAAEAAAAVSQTTSTVAEVRQTAELTSEKARQLSGSAQRAAQAAQSGQKSTADMAAGMERIRVQTEAIAGSMMRLTDQSQAIGQIIATVEDLAVQSMLLAVNAGIEAAKAGEHGRGFGVVAQEVKSLAEQSRQATNEIRALLGDVQQATAAAMMATEQGAKVVESGARQTEHAADAIRQLAGSANEAAQAAVQIAASSQQQLVGMEQVASAMENVRQASAQNAASSRQLEASARNLHDLGQHLAQIVKHYKV